MTCSCILTTLSRDIVCITAFRLHWITKSWQTRQLRLLRQRAARSSGEFVLITCDFSENIQLKPFRETQQDYHSRVSATLLVVVVHYGGSTGDEVIEQHFVIRYAMLVCIRLLLQEASAYHPLWCMLFDAW